MHICSSLLHAGQFTLLHIELHMDVLIRWSSLLLLHVIASIALYG